MTPPSPPAYSRLEWSTVLALTLIALGLRLAGFGRIGLTHFDEGVYAFAGLWSVTPEGFDPGVVSYAPAGYPVMVGVSYLIFGVSDVAAVLPALLCGVLTVPAAAWVGRRTFGVGAGAAAAAFAALAVVHVAFSRKALTDAPFLLTWFAATGLGGRFLERPGLLRAVVFGLAVGLAQNVKYNGALTGVIVALAAGLGVLTDPEARRPGAVLRVFGWGVFAAVVAGLVYLPWYRYVEAHGGYAALMRHHRSYVGGWSTWPAHWRQQLAQAVALSGGPFWTGSVWVVAWLAAGFATCGRRLTEAPTRLNLARLRLGLLAGAAVLAALPDAGWWAGLAWLPWLARDRRPAVRVLAAWWGLLSVMTPLYHPYARLWLPLHGAGWVLLAGVVVQLGPFTAAGRPEPAGWRALARDRSVVVRASVVLACLIGARLHWGDAPSVTFPLGAVYTPTDGLKVAAADLAAETPLSDPQAGPLHLLARRPLAFYLAVLGKPRFQLEPDAAAFASHATGGPTWLLVDDAVERPSAVQAALKSSPALVEDYEYNWYPGTDPVTLLDVRPEAVAPGTELRSLVLRLRGFSTKPLSDAPRSPRSEPKP